MTNDIKKEYLKDVIDDMCDFADAEGYHRGFDEAWDEARDKGFDEGFNEGLKAGAQAIIDEITKEIIPEQGFFLTPRTQAEYEAALGQFKESGPMCAALTTNYLHNIIKNLENDDFDA